MAGHPGWMGSEPGLSSVGGSFVRQVHGTGVAWREEPAVCGACVVGTKAETGIEI